MKNVFQQEFCCLAQESQRLRSRENHIMNNLVPKFSILLCRGYWEEGCIPWYLSRAQMHWEKISKYSSIDLMVNCHNYSGQSPPQLRCEGTAHTHGVERKFREWLSAGSASLGPRMGRETWSCSSSPVPISSSPVPMGAALRHRGQQEHPLLFQDPGDGHWGARRRGGSAGRGNKDTQ